MFGFSIKETFTGYEAFVEISVVYWLYVVCFAYFFGLYLILSYYLSGLESFLT